MMNFLHAHRPFLMARRVYMDCILFGVSFHKFTVFSAEYMMHSWSKLLQRDWKEVFGTWFVKGDLSVQHLNRRTTHLAESLLSHPHAELNEHCLFVLSGKDATIPTYDIYSYITEKNLKCRVDIDPEWRHGGFLFQPDPHNLWQVVHDWIAPKNRGFQRVRSHPSLRGHLFAGES